MEEIEDRVLFTVKSINHKRAYQVLTDMLDLLLILRVASTIDDYLSYQDVIVYINRFYDTKGSTLPIGSSVVSR